MHLDFARLGSVVTKYGQIYALCAVNGNQPNLHGADEHTTNRKYSHNEFEQVNVVCTTECAAISITYYA